MLIHNHTNKNNNENKIIMIKNIPLCIKRLRYNIVVTWKFLWHAFFRRHIIIVRVEKNIEEKKKQ